MNPRIIRDLNRSLSAGTDDTAVALWIWYDGPAQPTLTIDGSSDFSFFEDAAADTSVSGNGVIDESASATTIGALIDTINADTDGRWHATIAEAIRSLDTTQILASQAATAIVPNTGYPVLWDTSGLKMYVKAFGMEAITVADQADMLAAHKTNSGNHFGLRTPASGYSAGDTALPNIVVPSRNTARRSKSYAGALKSVKALINSSGTISIYDSSQTADTLIATLIGNAGWQPASIQDANTWWKSKKGNRLVVIAKDGTTAISTGTLEALGAITDGSAQLV